MNDEVRQRPTAEACSVDGGQSFCDIAWFNLVDLGSQMEAVAEQLQGFSAAEKLVWLGRQGEVVPHSVVEDGYTFVSPLGVKTLFRLSPEGDFIVGDA